MCTFGLLRVVLAPALLVLAMAIAGCDKGESNDKTGQAKPDTQRKMVEQPKPVTQPIIPVTQIADWCPEHGVPESICTRCNASLVAGFKAKGDWCDEHGLPDSQCFKHHPELKKKFAAAYKAQYGKEPPAVDGQEVEK
ncbi:MAG: RND transporter [Planctomycetes bacterium]|nr:RND transporter [Planctomycetota bacterium]